MPVSIDELVGRLADPDRKVRERARHTLAIIGEPAVPRVAPLVEHPDRAMRWEAVKTLSQIASCSSIDPLMRAVVDDEADIRWLAAEGLIRVGPASLSPTLRLLIQNPSSKSVRRAARQILDSESRENEVIGEIVGRVSGVLGDMDAPVAIIKSAEEALARVTALQSATC